MNSKEWLLVAFFILAIVALGINVAKAQTDISTDISTENITEMPEHVFPLSVPGCIELANAARIMTDKWQNDGTYLDSYSEHVRNLEEMPEWLKTINYWLVDTAKANPFNTGTDNVALVFKECVKHIQYEDK